MAYSISSFVIHEHNAKAAGLHWDLRIEIPNNNLLMSLAIPKANVPRNIGEKVLCVVGNLHGKYWLHIENMEIPEGQYGAGTIKLIQKGKMEIEGWGDKYITFYVRNGKYLKGRYSLIKFKGTKKGDEKQNMWILIKIKEKKVK